MNQFARTVDLREKQIVKLVSLGFKLNVKCEHAKTQLYCTFTVILFGF